MSNLCWNNLRRLSKMYQETNDYHLCCKYLNLSFLGKALYHFLVTKCISIEMHLKVHNDLYLYAISLKKNRILNDLINQISMMQEPLKQS